MNTYPKTVGILGGMGPEATVDLMHRVIRATPDWPFKTAIYTQTRDRHHEGQPLRAALLVCFFRSNWRSAASGGIDT